MIVGRGGCKPIGCNLAKDQCAGSNVGLLALVLSLSEGAVDMAGKAGQAIGDGLEADGPTDGVAQALVPEGMEAP
jgi:hypothetical protein